MKKIISVTMALLFIGSCFFGCSKDEYKNIDFATGNYSERGSDRTPYTQEAFNDTKPDMSNQSYGSGQEDPFDNLIVTFDGISPFCTISVNNSRCSENIQKYVKYSVSETENTLDTYFSAGDSVTLYAYAQSSSDEGITLSKQQNDYTVSDVPEFLIAFDDTLDYSTLKQYVNDYVEAIFASRVGIGEHFHVTTGFSETELIEARLSSLKPNIYSVYEKREDCFNRIDFIFKTKHLFDDGAETVEYFTVIAKNVVKNPDGTIGWGNEDPGNLDLSDNWNESKQILLDQNIISKKDRYNVESINITLN